MPYDFNKAMANPLTSLGLSLVANTQNPGQAIQQGLNQGLAMKKEYDREGYGKLVAKAMADPQLRTVDGMQKVVGTLVDAGVPMEQVMPLMEYGLKASAKSYDKYKTVGDSLVDLDTGKPIYTAPVDYSKEPLQEIYDPTSPSGTRLVGRREAAGKPGKPGSGLKFTTDKDGNVTLEQGSGLGMGGGGSGLGAPTINKINEANFNSQEMLARLDQMDKSFDPAYLQLAPRAGAKLASMKDFLGVELDPVQKERLAGFTKFRQDAATNLNTTMKELSGQAISAHELPRMQAQLPNAGMGVFDGDSPTEFKTKMDNSRKSQRAAVLRYNYAIKNGLDPLKTGIALEKVPELIEKRGNEIEAEIKQQYPSLNNAQLEAEVSARLYREFGGR